MHNLNDEQILILRREIGDTGGESILSSVELNLAYNQSAGNWSKTKLKALDWMRAHYAKAVTTSSTEERKCHNNALFAHYDKLYKDAEYDAKWGGGLKVSTIDLGMDAD